MTVKILFNTYSSAFITPGGGEVQLKKTYEALLKNDVQVDLYDPWQPQLEKYDIVHYFSVYGGSLPFCKAVKAAGKRLVVSPVLWLDDLQKYPIAEIKEILYMADLILPNSRMEAELLVQKLGIPAEKFMPVYNAVEPKVFQNIDADLFKNKHGLFRYALNVANIEPRKNQLHLIEAMSEADIPLVIIGYVRDQAYYEQCRKIAQEKKVYFINPLPHNSTELLSAYAGAEIFVLPSILETPGLAALEAAAAGCGKIVVTGVGCTREYFGDYVEYIDDILDSEQIKKAIMRRMKEKTAEEKLQEHILQNFSWQRAALQTQAAYEKVLNLPVSVNSYDEFDDGFQGLRDCFDIEDVQGVYPLEHDERGSFFWLGKRGLLTFKKPADFGIIIEMCAPTEDNFCTVTTEQGGFSETIATVPYWKEYVLLFPEKTKQVCFEIEKIFKPENDNRDLGICIRSIKKIEKNQYGEMKALMKRNANELLNEQEFRKRELIPQSYPPGLRISIERRCNFNPPCVYCDWEYVKNLEKKIDSGEFSLPLFDELGQYYENAAEVVDCSHGEPFLHPEIGKILEKLSADKKHFEFTTNGSLLNAQNQELLLGKDVHMYVSIDASNEVTYSHYRNNCFNLIVENLKTLCKKKRQHENLPEVTVSFLAMTSNYHEIRDFIILCKNIGVDSVKVRFLDRYSNLKEKSTLRNNFLFVYKDQMLSDEEIEKASEEIIKIAKEEKVKLWVDQLEQSTEEICDEPWRKLYFFNRGVMPCCFARVPLIEDVPVHMNMQEKIRYVFASPQFQKLRQELAEGKIPQYCQQFNCPLVRAKANNNMLHR